MPARPANAGTADIFGRVCGIVGYVGNRPARQLLLDGLRRLEYRGYDSAGISVIEDDHIEAVRAVGNLAALQAKLDELAADRPVEEGEAAVAVAQRPAVTGIGHTRWATHGRVSEENAHPHCDSGDRVHVVVNGIVENYMLLKERLGRDGSVFSSETDAEVIAHLIASHYDGDLPAAVRAAYGELQGHYAFVAMSLDEPDVLVGARRECPLIVGRGDGEQFVASAVPAFLSQTRRVQFLDNDEIVVLRPEGVLITTPAGEPIERPVETVDWDEATAEKAGYETFMLKEIYEQADAVAETIADRTAGGDGVELDEQGVLDERMLADVRRIVIVACGTSYHAGLIGRYVIEEWARLPVEMDIASEYRYRNPVLGRGDLVVGISQSGETADTLAAMRMARRARRARACDHQRDGLAGHARVRRDAVHPRRPRDGRGGDQDLPVPGRGHVPAGAAPGRAARLAGSGARRGAGRRDQAAAAEHRRGAGADSRRGCAHRRRVLAERVLSVHRPSHRSRGRARGGAEAEGDLLHRHRRLRRR